MPGLACNAIAAANLCTATAWIAAANSCANSSLRASPAPMLVIITAKAAGSASAVRGSDRTCMIPKYGSGDLLGQSDRFRLFQKNTPMMMMIQMRALREWLRCAQAMIPIADLCSLQSNAGGGGCWERWDQKQNVAISEVWEIVGAFAWLPHPRRHELQHQAARRLGKGKFTHRARRIPRASSHPARQCTRTY